MNERPLSPHLQVYRLPITAVLSITHRITGLWLLVGMAVFVIVLMSAADGSQPFVSVQILFRSTAGRLLLWTWLFALYFHLCHGIRHLVWDTGHGFCRETLTWHSWIELGSTVLMTGVTVLLAHF